MHQENLARKTRAMGIAAVHEVHLYHRPPTDLLTSSVGIADPGAFELTNDELLQLVEKVGFRIEQTEFEIPSPYIHDNSSMLHNTYRASFWVARKI
jgi:hypothetical protein